MTSDFLVGTILGSSIGSAVLALLLSQFFGRLSNCIDLNFKTSDYKCQHQSQMTTIWFWSGLMFWLESLLSIVIVFGKDDLLYNTQNYESIGIALEELENNFQQNAVFQHPHASTSTSSSSSSAAAASTVNLAPQANDGTFFGSARSIGTASGHTEIGEVDFPTTPSQEAAVAAYGSSYHQHQQQQQQHQAAGLMRPSTGENDDHVLVMKV